MVTKPYWQNATSTLLQPLLLANSRGLITDMDGTLSPIVDDPAAAVVTPRSRDLLAALQQELPLVAVISGRAAADVQQRVNLPGVLYMGNHGLESWLAGEVSLTPQAAKSRAGLEAAMAALEPVTVPGLQVEDKGATVSVHYRRTADPTSVAANLRPMLQELAALHELDLFEGRMVFELRPPIPINKGTAFRQLVTTHQLDAAVYLGDDTTDVDALRMARQLRDQQRAYCVGVGVVSDGTPDSVVEAADVLAAGVSGVEDFLAWLLKSCQASST